MDGKEKILTPNGNAKTWWIYPKLTAVPLVKGKNGVIDYTVPVQPTQYDEATRLLGRDEIAHKQQQSKTISAMDMMTDVQDKWLNMDFDVSVEKYQRDMLEIQRQMERCCYMQHKLRGMSDEDATELAHAIHSGYKTIRKRNRLWQRHKHMASTRTWCHWPARNANRHRRIMAHTHVHIDVQNVTDTSMHRHILKGKRRTSTFTL